VRLPLANDRVRPTLERPRAAENTGSRLSILVADDNLDAAASLAMLLELGGHRVEVVNDGAAALRALARYRFNIALLASGCPHERVRDREARAGLRLGARHDSRRRHGVRSDTDKDQAFAAGFDHHWVKPIEPSAALDLAAATSPRAH
jgi:CheY-like chemotaxis protein